MTTVIETGRRSVERRRGGMSDSRSGQAGHGQAGRGEAEPGPRRTETRQRILEAAGRLFRAQGIDATGIDAIMREAGLTHGGFYLHFPSKEALAAEVAGTLLQGSARRWQDVGTGVDPAQALCQIVETYLDPERIAAGKCCALASLGPDVARRPASREAMGDALRSMLDTLTACLPQHRPEQAAVALSTMVGAVVLSRLADDPVLAASFLEAARSALLSGPDGPAGTPDLPPPGGQDDVA